MMVYVIELTVNHTLVPMDFQKEQMYKIYYVVLNLVAMLTETLVVSQNWMNKYIVL